MKNESAVERQILDYLASQPAAQDTLRGIVEWWMLKQRTEARPSNVEAALANLAASGKLQLRVGVDGETSYRLERASGMGRRRK
jgi:hypothetical protein